MKLFVIAAVVALVLAGCAGLDLADRSGSAQDSEPAAAASPEATPSPEPTAVESRCGGSLEGCFGYDEMDDYLEAITPLVADFFQTAYPDVAAPQDIVYVPDGRAARSYCGPSTDTAYEYCSANQTIYIGQNLLWAFYRQAGDAAPAVALAHEWGHHLQYMLGVPFGRTRSQAIEFENQADCVSGAWARHADEQGWLEEDDLSDVSLLLQLIGARESRARDHGTTEERTEAFQSAYEQGIAACNAYSPGAPLA